MKCWKSSKGLIRLACWLLALLLAGCSGSSEGDLVVPQFSIDGAGAVTTTRTRYLSGSVEAGATVEVMVGTDEIPADKIHVAGGRWSCTLDTLQAGSNLLTVTALDPTGNQNIFNFYLIYDALSIESYTTPVPDSALTIGGLFDPKLDLAVPEVQVGTATAAAATVDGDQWSYDLSGQLATGNNTITVTVTHPDLGVVTKTLTINVSASSPQLGIDPVTTPTVAATQTLSGSWTGDAEPVVAVPTATVGTPSTDPAVGTWSVDLTDLGAGKNTVAVSATGSGVTATAHTLIAQQIFTDRTPYAGQYDVDPNNPGISITFSEAMDPTTLTADSFVLKAGFGDDLVAAIPIAATVSYDPATRTATLVPDAALAAGTNYTVQVTIDVHNAADAPLAHAVSWVFTTL